LNELMADARKREAIAFAFQDYYRTTLLAEETDPNKLHDLKAARDAAQVYSRPYSLLSSVIPYRTAERQKLSILLNLRTPKLPAPQEEDLAKGILEAIDMDSYRVEKKAAMKIALADKDAEIEPVPTDAHGHKPEPELNRLSNILRAFNEQFGTLFTDTDRVAKRIR